MVVKEERFQEIQRLAEDYTLNILWISNPTNKGNLPSYILSVRDDVVLPVIPVDELRNEEETVLFGAMVENMIITFNNEKDNLVATIKGLVRSLVENPNDKFDSNEVFYDFIRFALKTNDIEKSKSDLVIATMRFLKIGKENVGI